MISNNKANLFRLNNKNIDFKKVEQKKDDLDTKNPAGRARGTTEIVPVDVSNKFNIEEKTSETENSAVTIKNNAPAAPQNDDNTPLPDNLKLKDFIVETLKNAGIEPTDELVIDIYIQIVESSLDGQFVPLTIKNVTELIDLNLMSEHAAGIKTVTNIIDALLQMPNETAKDNPTTYGQLREFILNIAAPSDIQPTVEPETNEINTPQAALEALSNAIDAGYMEENMTVNDFLLQFQTEASKYIQLEFGYGEGFSDLLAAFMAQATFDKCGVESGLIIDADLDAIKAKFFEFIQDMSFLDTTNDVEAWLPDNYGGAKGRVDWIKAELSEDGFIIRGTIWYGDNSNLTYSYNGKPNHGLLLKFMMNYFRDTVYFGTLTESQLQYVIQKALEDFGQGCHIPMSSEGKLNLWGNKTDLDKNHNSTFFDDLFESMMRVCEDLKPIDVTKADSIDLDELFGDKNSLTAADIHNAEGDYLTSDDPGIRAIFGALVQASNQYNITTDVDYLDFLNVFIRMFNDMCGVANTNPPTISRQTLENYLNRPNAVQELREFVMSKELRNAYYMETFVINEEIEDFSQDNYTGDCWLLAALITLKQTQAGRDLIANAIDSYVGEDGKTYYTVTLRGGYDASYSSYGCYVRGVVKTTVYTFSEDEIFDEISTGNYSNGLDWDTKLIEIAIGKLREEQWAISEFAQQYQLGEEGNIYLYGGYEGELMFYLTGFGSPRTGTGHPYNIITKYPGDEITSATYNGVNPLGQPLISYERTNVTREDFRDRIRNAILNGTLESGKIPENSAYVILMNSHAYGVVGFTTDGIYYVDPGDTTKTLFMSWDEYINKNISLTYIPLNLFDEDTYAQIYENVTSA